jgi:hypothetical protein
VDLHRKICIAAHVFVHEFAPPPLFRGDQTWLDLSLWADDAGNLPAADKLAPF